MQILEKLAGWFVHLQQMAEGRNMINGAEGPELAGL